MIGRKRSKPIAGRYRTSEECVTAVRRRGAQAVQACLAFCIRGVMLGDPGGRPGDREACQMGVPHPNVSAAGGYSSA